MPRVYEGVGFEQLIDEITFVLVENLNDMIDAMQIERWTPRDEARALKLGIDPPVLYNVEHVSPENLIQGDIPSLINANMPTEKYPNVCITPEQMQPDPEDANQDQRNVYQNVLDIHSVVKARPTVEEGPIFTYFRAVRTCEALHEVVMRNPKLKYMLQGISNPQLVQPSAPFEFQPLEGHGDDWWWRSARIRYLIKVYTTAL